MVAAREDTQAGEETLDASFQDTVQILDLECVGKLLRPRVVGDVYDQVVQQAVGDAGFGECGREAVVAVAVELHPERGPGGNPQVAQPPVGIDEVDVVVQALSAAALDEALACRTVVPGAVAGAGLDSREDVHDARVVTALSQDFLDPLLLSKALVRDVLDLQPSFLCQGFDVLTDCLGQLLGPVCEVEDPDPTGVQESGHRLRVADVWKGPHADHTIKAAQDSLDPVPMTFDELKHRQPRLQEGTPLLVPATLA